MHTYLYVCVYRIHILPGVYGSVAGVVKVLLVDLALVGLLAVLMKLLVLWFWCCLWSLC